MKELLSGACNFECLEIPPKECLTLVISSQEQITNVLKSLHKKESLTDMLCKKISPGGCCPWILYGQAKVHIPMINNCSSFRPILNPYLNLTRHSISYKISSAYFISING